MLTTIDELILITFSFFRRYKQQQNDDLRPDGFFTVRYDKIVYIFIYYDVI